MNYNGKQYAFVALKKAFDGSCKKCAFDTDPLGCGMNPCNTSVVRRDLVVSGKTSTIGFWVKVEK